MVAKFVYKTKSMQTEKGKVFHCGHFHFREGSKSVINGVAFILQWVVCIVGLATTTRQGGHVRLTKQKKIFPQNLHEKRNAFGPVNQHGRSDVSCSSREFKQQQASSGSESFSLSLCLDANKFVLLSVFTMIETIC